MDRAVEGLGRRHIFAEPVAGLTHAREDPRLAGAPAFLGAGHEQRARVAIDGRADLHSPSRAIAGDEKSIRRTLRRRAVLGVQVERGQRPELEMVGGQRTMPGGEQVVGHQLMESHAFSFRQACVSDVLQRCVAKAPVRGWPAWRRRSHLLADENLCINELLQLLRGGFRIDGRELLEVKGVHEDRGAPCELAQPGRERIEARAHDGLHCRRKRPPTRRRSSVAVRHQHAGRLDDEEWIAACSLGNLDRFGVGDVAAAGVAHQVNRLV